MRCGSSQMITPQIIREIQLDAMKEGMRRAADIVKKCAWGDTNNYETLYKPDPDEAILTAAEQLTEKDL